ncbi:MAG: protein-glutamate O-methyltransferase CheR [Deferribacteres bacterium]|nr:protein-glutamate O-methyltransferase CheR [Deferribacteres bacterium]
MEISYKELDEISKIIYRTSGLYLQKRDKDKLLKYIEKKLAEGRFRSLEHFKKELEHSKSVLYEVFDVLTINETFFFRHKSHFNILEKEILPKLFKEKQSVKLWSAACSTGEEPYSMAITALEVMEKLKIKKTVRVIANDISQKVLKVAQEGVYGSYAIRFVPPDILKKYFIKQPDGKYKISPKVKSMVRFMHLSLTDEAGMKRIGNDIDVVFCRNVLIYFDIESRKKALSLIHYNMNKGAYLFLGPAESARGLIKGLKIVLFPGAIVYCKE